MVTKCLTPENGNLKVMAAVVLFFLSGMALTYSQVIIPDRNDGNIENTWWYPIVQKHAIDISRHNFRFGFSVIKPDTAFNEKWIELGMSDSLNYEKVSYKNGIVISKDKSGRYFIKWSEFGQHDFIHNNIAWKNVKAESFNFDSAGIEPLETYTMDLIRLEMNTFTLYINK